MRRGPSSGDTTLTRTFVIAGIAAAATALTVGAVPQPPQPVPPVPLFRSGVNLVTVDVSVLDRDRRPVRGLTAADFTILENGQPQPVTAFSAIDLPDADPDAPVWLRDVHPDIVRNDDFAGRRTVVLVLDDATPMPAAEAVWVRTWARQVIEQLGPDDLAAVVYTFDKSLGQELTRDRARLLTAADRFNGGVTGSQVDASGRVRETPFSSFDSSAMTMYLATITTLRSLAEALAELPQRRKTLVFISVGVPLDTGDLAPRITVGDHNESSGQHWTLLQELFKGFAAAQRANVNIYSLDPGGLRPSPSNLNSDFLQAVSSNTGGFAITDTNDPGPGITQVFRENGSYYLLGYRNPDPKAEGRYRRIDVKVYRPGVIVRARQGYFEASPEKKKPAKAPPSLLSAAIDGPVPRTDVPLQVTAAAFPLAGRREAAVAVVVGIRTPAPVGRGPALDNLDVQVSAYDTRGTWRGAARMTGKLVHHPGAVEETGFEVIARLDLKPGRYQLRVAAESSRMGKSGSVYTDVDVPDFSKDAVGISGLVLSVTPRLPTAPKDGLPDLLPVIPTSERHFSPNATVTALLRLRQGGDTPLVPLTLALRIVDAANATVFEDKASIGPERFSAGRLADYRFDLPIAALPSGPYLLTVDLPAPSNHDAKHQPPRRAVPFRVR